MTTELIWLTLSAVLAASLWVPYIVLSSRPENAAHQSFVHMAHVWEMSDITQRAYRAHQNMVEQFAPFAVVVMIAHVAGVSNMITVWASAAFFVLRLAHAVGYISGLAQMPLRPLIFLGGWLCTLSVAGTVLLT